MKLNRFPLADKNKKRFVESADRARPMIEPLEDRQMLSLTVDLRLIGGATTANVTSVGQVLNIQVCVVVSGNTAGGDDGLQDLCGSILSNKSATGSVDGNLTSHLTPDYTADGSQSGTQADLNGQGNLDIGSNNNAEVEGFLFARAGQMEYDGVVTGNSQLFVVASMQYTVTSLSDGQSTNINFRFRDGVPAGAFDAVWVEDGNGENDQMGTIAVGPGLTISDSSITPPVTGTISGTVNKSVSGTTSAFSGQTVYLDLTDSGVLASGDPTAVSSSSGAYSFTGVDAGTYDLREVVPTGYTLTSPSTTPTVVTISSGNTSVTQNFTDTAVVNNTASIAGFVYGNGIGLPNVTVFIDLSDTSKISSSDPTTVTSSTGAYSFTGLAAGSYEIGEVAPFGYSPTTAESAVSLSVGQAVTGHNITNTAGTASVSGVVDQVVNGVTSVFSGVSVYLDLNDSGAYVSSDPTSVTSSTGAFSLKGLTAGTYYLREEVPSGYTQTSPGSGITFIVNAGQAITAQTFIDTANTVVVSGSQLSGTVIGTSGSYQNDGDTIADAFDGNLNTYYNAASANGNWAGLNLGATYTISQIKYSPRSGWASRMVGGIFQGSNDPNFVTGVVALATVTSTPATGVYTTVSVSTPTAFQYVRYLSPNGSYGNVAEVQFFGTKVSSTTKQLTGTVIGTSGSWENEGNTIAKAFDGSLTTYFDGPVANGDWAGLDLGSAQTITSISYAPRTSWAGRMVGGIFQGSNSATFSSGVVNLYTITATPAYNVLTTVNVSNSGTYRYVRYLGPNGSYGDVSEVVFFGT